MKCKLLNLACGTVVTLSMSSLATQAQAVVLYFTLDGILTSATGTGTVTIDDTFFGPNLAVSLTKPPEITAFQATFTGLSTTPSTTSFDLSDVTQFSLFTDANTDIIDFNFVTNANADNYTSTPPSILLSELRQNGVLVDGFNINITESQAVPEPLTILGSIAALGFGAKLRKKLLGAEAAE